MAETIGKLAVELALDSSGFKTGLSGATKEIQKTTGTLNEMKMAADANASSMQSSTSIFKSAGFSFTELNSAIMIGKEALGAMRQAYDSIIAPTVAYADQVRDLSRISGASAEDTSRLIQASDDLMVSYESLETAARMAAKNGINFTTDSLAEMSDEYLKLNKGSERASYLLEKFGRSGLEMGKILERGSDSIKEMSGNISENMIMTQKNIEEAKQYKESLDALNDAMSGLGMTIGKSVIPALTEIASGFQMAIDDISGNNEELKKMRKEYSDWMAENPKATVEEFTKKWKDLRVEYGYATSAMKDIRGASDDVKESLEEQKEAAEKMKEGLDMVSEIVAGRLGKSFTDYKDNLADLKKEESELLQQLNGAKNGIGNYDKKLSNLDERITESREENFNYSKSLGEMRAEMEKLHWATLSLSDEALEENIRQQESLKKRIDNEIEKLNESQTEYEKYYHEKEELILESEEAEKKAHDETIAKLEENRLKQKELEEQLQRTTKEFIFQKISQDLTAGAAAMLARDLGLMDVPTANLLIGAENIKKGLDADHDGLVSLSEYAAGNATKSIQDFSNELITNSGKKLENEITTHVITSYEVQGKESELTGEKRHSYFYDAPATKDYSSDWGGSNYANYLGMANGGSFTVPSGFPNDTFPMRVSSGEKVTVDNKDSGSRVDLSDASLRKLSALILAGSQ